MPIPAVLRPYVAGVHSYDVDLGAPGVHRGLPGTHLTVVVPVGERLDVSWSDGGSRRAVWSSVAGLHTSPAAIHHTGIQHGVMADLTVAGSRALLGLPAGSLAAGLLTLDEVAPGLADLPERLADAAPRDRLRLVIDRLVAEASRSEAAGSRAEVAHALAMLTRGSGVDAVAAEVGFSRRRLGALVAAEVGLSPRGFRRLARFEHAHRLLGHRPLAEVAASCGFSDQAHLTREWRALAGCTPTTWLREEFPFVQDGQGADPGV